MTDAAAPIRGGRGSDLLLMHCTALSGGSERPPAHHRLEELVGGELARMRIAALSARRSGRPAA
jgi:hypothetical protein